MAITAFPFDGQDTTEAQYSAFFRELQDSGVIGGFGDASLRVTADSTGMQVKIAPGSAILRGHCLISTAIETRAITAAAAQPRIDAVVARLDPATDSIALIVLPGAPATNPAPPTLQQTDTGQWDLPLALVTVAAGTATIAAGAVAERRPYIGQHVGAWSADTRPTAPRRARLGLNTTTLAWEYWTGTGWADLAPTVTWDSVKYKPLTFAPSAHAHAIGDVSGLTDALNARPSTDWVNVQLAGKAPTTHSHTLAQIQDWPGMSAASGGNTVLRRDGAGEAGLHRLYLTLPPSDPNHAARKLDVDWAYSTLTAALASGLAGKANSYGDVNTAAISQQAHGPTSGSYSRTVGSSYFAVYMDSGLLFGRNVSSRRYKEDVTPAKVDVQAVLALEPVTFHRKADEDPGARDLGLIAEDSTAVDHLVIWDTERDDEGNPVEGAELRPEGVRYETVLPVALLAVVKAQQAQIDALTARLDAIKEVSA